MKELLPVCGPKYSSSTHQLQVLETEYTTLAQQETQEPDSYYSTLAETISEILKQVHHTDKQEL